MKFNRLLRFQASVQTLQDNLKYKEEELMKYQTLLKIDKDKYSLGAARFQEELQALQGALEEEKQKGLRCEKFEGFGSRLTIFVFSLKESFSRSRPNRVALEEYINQVHALEKHTAELHTKITSLDVQLQSSRQEAVRWRSVANDRLEAMEDLRNK